jgi:hypothetical protein
VRLNLAAAVFARPSGSKLFVPLIKLRHKCSQLAMKLSLAHRRPVPGFFTV